MISYPAVVALPVREIPVDPRQARTPITGLGLEAAHLLEDLGRALERDLSAARAAADRLVQFLATARPCEGTPIRGGLAPWQRRRIDQYLEAHLEESIHVETLAEALPLSVSHFCRAFKETFGETPHAHIMRLRLERAKHMMLSTEEPLSQIALACGLADQAHLSKLFRRRVGESPSNWRRRHLRGPSPAEAPLRRPTRRYEPSW
jgi:AraC-like DNA-binding protein